MTVQVHRAKQCRPRKGGFLRRSPTFSSTSVFFGHLVLHNTYDDEDLPYIYTIYIPKVPKGSHQFIIFQPVQTDMQDDNTRIIVTVIYSMVRSALLKMT